MQYCQSLKVQAVLITFFAIVVVIWLHSLKNVLHRCGMNDNMAILHIENSVACGTLYY